VRRGNQGSLSEHVRGPRTLTTSIGVRLDDSGNLRAWQINWRSLSESMGYLRTPGMRLSDLRPLQLGLSMSNARRRNWEGFGVSPNDQGSGSS
jgi:hypothetical protein